MRTTGTRFGILVAGIFLILGFGFLTTVSAGAGQESSIGEDSQGMIQDQPDQSAEMEKNLEMFGQFSSQGKRFTGSFVDFSFESGEFSDYALTDGEMIFDSFVITGGEESTYTTETDGAVFKAVSGDITASSHNNPTAMIQIRYGGSDQITVNFALADGLEVTEEESVLNVMGLEDDAHLFGDNYLYEIGEGYVEFTMSPDSMVIFMISPHQERSAVREAVCEGIASRNVDGELQIQLKDGSTYAYQHFKYEGKVDMEPAEVDEGKKVRIRVSSEEHKGKTVAVMLQGDVLSGEDPAEIRAMFDQQEMVREENPVAVLEANGDRALYCIEKDDNGNYQALVYVPEFSVHEIEFSVDGQEEEDSPMPFAIVIAGIVSLAVIGILTFKRRK